MQSDMRAYSVEIEQLEIVQGVGDEPSSSIPHGEIHRGTHRGDGNGYRIGSDSQK